MANRARLRAEKAKLVEQLGLAIMGQYYVENLVGRVVRRPGGKDPLPQGRPGPGLVYQQGLDGTVTIVKE